MEALIETYFPETMKISSAFRSFAFQPERVSLNSQDDITGANEGNDKFGFYSFTIRLARPCLNVKSLQLLRCSIPTPLPSFPDNELVFWYYRSTNPSVPNTKANLAFIRLLPNKWLSFLYPKPAVGYPLIAGNQYGYNRSFTDYQDLVDELNRACANDPSNGSSPGTTPNFYANDITFGYDQRSNRIYFTGNTAGYYYTPVSYEDPNLTNQTNGSTGFQILQQFSLLTANPAIGAGSLTDPDGQNYNPFRPLSLRLGWTWNNQPTQNTQYLITAQGQQNYASTYADLVYSSDVYIYVDFIGASSLDSAGNSGLLAVVPLNTANNAVGFYNNVLSNPLTKIPTQIQEVRIVLKDDAGNQLILPNSAVVNLEIGFAYH
jgi:hypothetical protein